MLLHNRRRRNEWLAEQQAKTARDVAEARRAEAIGQATEDQMLLINRERAADEAAEARRNRPGVFKRATSWLYSGLSTEEQKGGRLGAAAGATTQALKQESVGQQHDRSVLQAVEDKVNENRRQGCKAGRGGQTAGRPIGQTSTIDR